MRIGWIRRTAAGGARGLPAGLGELNPRIPPLPGPDGPGNPFPAESSSPSGGGDPNNGHPPPLSRPNGLPPTAVAPPPENRGIQSCCCSSIYSWQGGIMHEDFTGRKGTIKAGDLQWMTAGKGIVHSEMPAGQDTHKGLQLWVNLSSQNKMIEPKYQEMQSKDIATVARDGVEVRVIAGESMGVKSPIRTRTPTMYLDFTLSPSSRLRQPVPPTWNSFVYVLEGEGVFGREGSPPVGPHNLLLLGHGDGLEAWNRSGKPLRFVVVGGEPLGEPVAQLGPFVMNTEEEIDRTIQDYEQCVNGFEKARYWRSEAMLGLRDIDL